MRIADVKQGDVFFYNSKPYMKLSPYGMKNGSFHWRAFNLETKRENILPDNISFDLPKEVTITIVR